MWNIYTIRADYEGWWLFDDWPEKVIDHQAYQSEMEMLDGWQKQLLNMRKQFPNEIVGKHNIHAFYRNCEIEYCEDCEEDLQIYYSIILMENNEVYDNYVKKVN